MTERNGFPQVPGWETVRKLGSGSYGTVYEIRRELFGHEERAALKHIRLPRSDSEVEELYGSGYDEAGVAAQIEEQLADIVREYSLMAEMKGHTNILYCDDIRYEPQKDGVGWDIYIRMELLTPLLKALNGEMAESEVIRLGKDICRALSLCRSRNIVHRDIKPQNILVSADGNYKLGDFGIARTMERTSGATRIGSFNYMAPEVYGSRPYGHTADLYSLGLVLYWLLNERRGPFLPLPPKVPTVTEQDRCRERRMRGEPLPPPAHGSEALKRVVLRACAFDPRERYQTAEELLAALEAAERVANHVPAWDAPEEVTLASYPGEDRADPEEKTVGAYGARSKEPTPVKTEREEAFAFPEDKTVGAKAPRFSGTEPRNERTEPQAFPEEMTVGLPGKHADHSAAKQPEKPPARSQTEPAVKPEPRREEPPQKADETTAGNKPKKKTGLILGIAAVVIVAVLAVVLLLPKSGGGTGNTSVGTESADTSGETSVQSGTSIEPSYTFVDGVLTLSGMEEISEETMKELIPDWADFRNEIIEIQLDDQVRRIGNGAFASCIHLQTITIPKGTESIGGNAFSDCVWLTSISIPESVTRIEGNAFSGCIRLNDVTIPNGVTSIGLRAFTGCTGLTSVSIAASVTDIGESAFYGCSSLANLTLENGIESIGWGAFQNCSGLREITIPGSVIAIGDHSFVGCEGMTNITIQEGVQSIGSLAFAACKKLERVTIPDGVTRIPYRAFVGCSSLTSIILPDSITNIETDAFEGCDSLTDIYYQGTEEQWTALVQDRENDAPSAVVHFNS